MTDPARRLEYLQAIGVDVWVSRHGPAPAAAEDSGNRLSELARGSETEVVPSFPADARAEEGQLSSQPLSGQPRRGQALSAQPHAEQTPLPVEVQAQWDSLKAEVLSCKKCALHTTRTQGVFGVGNRRADWLIIGEAPGAEEDRQGEPFVGRGGQLLNAMLRAIGLPRETVFIANVLKSRPPGNRDPKPEEVAACLPYLMRQIALLQPKLMLAVGRIAAQNLLATDVSLGRLRGQVHTFGELNTPLIVTYHPAYLLRTPADKRKAWEDLKFARSVFKRLASQEL
jgi:uracil-DNA glycosylase